MPNRLHSLHDGSVHAQLQFLQVPARTHCAFLRGYRCLHRHLNLDVLLRGWAEVPSEHHPDIHIHSLPILHCELYLVSHRDDFGQLHRADGCADDTRSGDWVHDLCLIYKIGLYNTISTHRCHRHRHALLVCGANVH